MNVLVTGVTSFTGCWFAEALAETGAKVVATTRRAIESYSPIERARLDKAKASGVDLVTGIAFGDPEFLALLREGGHFDLLCHHGADVVAVERVVEGVDGGQGIGGRVGEDGGRGRQRVPPVAASSLLVDRLTVNSIGAIPLPVIG